MNQLEVTIIINVFIAIMVFGGLFYFLSKYTDILSKNGPLYRILKDMTKETPDSKNKKNTNTK